MMLAVFVFISLLFVLDGCLAGPIIRGHISTAMSSRQPSKRDLPKIVAAHHMVGNTYNYTQQTWLSDIQLAHDNGIDAFVLNVGRDSWQPQQVASAFQAAEQSGTGFKLFLSFDMTSLPCSTADDAATLRNYITTYASHPNQLIYDGGVFATTFAGESCTFGQNSVQSGWSVEFLKPLSGKYSICFVPSFFIDTSTMQSFGGVIKGMSSWNSGWPTQLKASSLSSFASNVLGSLATFVGATTSDNEYINNLRAISGIYMAAVSPWFFTHYSPQTYNKNFMYLSDDHLYAKRWDALIAIRDQVNIAQIISWNDYGESHYIGPIEGQQPNSQAWVDGFDHQGWLKMTSYYATAFKTGSYPTICKDQVFMWSRSHPVDAKASDSVGPPANYQLSRDMVWAVVFATAPASFTLSTSSTESQTFQIAPGVTRLSVPIHAGGYMKAVLQRNSQTVVDLQPEGFQFNPSPPSYNFNAFVASST